MKNRHFASVCIAALMVTPAFAENEEAVLGDWGVEIQHLSETVSPGEDFFTYVNEGWLESAEIPSGRSQFGSFSELRILSEDRIKAIILAMVGGDFEHGSSEQQISDLFSSYMNTDALDDNAMATIQGQLARIAAIRSLGDMLDLSTNPGHGSPFSPYVWIDDGDSTRHIVHLSQGGLGMGDRDYYLTEGEEYDAYRAAYLVYIARLLELTGEQDVEEKARSIFALETAIAEIQWTRTQNRDPEATYHLMSRDELSAFVPGIDWDRFLVSYGADDQTELVLTNDTATQAMAVILQNTPIDDLRNYMKFQFLTLNAQFISTRHGDAAFDFFNRTLNGIEEQLPRDQRAVQYISNNLGDLVGQTYVDQYFPPESRALMEELVAYLRRAVREQITNATWMDAETREAALYKLDNFNARIGYPDRYNDFSDLEIRADDLFGNRMRISQWYRNDGLSRLGEPVRDWEWLLTPQTVNAYYQSNTNQIVFPAAILQAPFFDPNADPAVNFGAIGGGIGHEMGHGFDDQGSQYDGDGVLRDWWSASSRANFEERVSGLVDQYGSFEALDDMFLNGELTLGENIGDHSGTFTALRAYEMYIEDHGGEAPVIDGYTGVQRFYMGWAQLWRRIRTEDSLRSQILQGPHSPGVFRVNGTFQNHDDWYEAFGVEEGDPLYVAPEDRVRLWE